MTRLILLGVLLTFVYSWEDVKRFLRLIAGNKHKHKDHYDLHLNRFVATTLMFVSLPISLVYFVASEGDLTAKLIALSIQLIAIALFAYGIGVFMDRMKAMNFAINNTERIVVITYSLAGLFTPVVRYVDPWSIERKLITKFTIFLSLPALAGLAMKYLGDKHIDSEFLPQLDLLIQIAVIGIIMNIAVEFLEKYFRRNRFGNLTTYLRILIGIVIGSVFIIGLV